MYSTHFGLASPPFLPLSDPEEIFRSTQVREIVQHFAHARAHHHALFLLTGEVGTGKTTAMQAVERELPAGTPIARVSPATSTPNQLLDELSRGFGLPRRAGQSKPERLRRLEADLARLHEKAGTPVVLLDEAHLLPDRVLEAVRLLTNLRHDRHPALQVCLVGQPELVERLRASHLRQLRQRITLRYGMLPLTLEETELYLIERLRAAGSAAPGRVFEVEAVRALHAATGGLPREINVVADQALMNAFLDHSRVVRRGHVDSVARDFAFEGVVPPRAEPPGDDEDEAPAGAAAARATLRDRLRAAGASALGFLRARPVSFRLGLAFVVTGAALALGFGWMASDGPTPAPAQAAMEERESEPPADPGASESSSEPGESPQRSER